MKKKIKAFIAKHSAIQLKASFVSENTLFEGKVAVVTGGLGDIGRAVTARMLSSGARVVLIGRNAKKMESRLNEKVKYVEWDITDLSVIEDRMEKIIQCFGKVDIWVNNAGVISRNDLSGDFFHATQEDWDQQFQVNAKAMYFITQRVCRYYIENHIKGHIVQILSIDGIRNTWQIYGLSKRVGIGLTKGIAKIAAPYGIVINGVCPGGVATQMIADRMIGPDNLRKDSVPSGRLSTPEEIANTVWFLAGDSGGQIGNIIVHDGGDTL